MDEAERCNRLAYLSSGSIIVQGSVTEVIYATGLVTILIKGDLTAQLLLELKATPGVVQAAWFGRNFHVCCYGQVRIERSLQTLSNKYKFTYAVIPSSLEDAFIALGHGQELRI
jgi:ABC-2 type transport system ATP-binding protein